MRTWIGIGIGLALFAAAPRAEAAQGRAFDKVRTGSWAYAAIRRVESQGFYTGSPAGVFSGERQLTRYEFAVATERLFRWLQNRALAAGEAGALPEQLRDLRRLFDEFGEDLAELGPDVAEMRRQLDQMQQRVDRLGRTPEGALAAAPQRELFQQTRRLPPLARTLRLAREGDPLGLSQRPAHLRPLAGSSLSTGLATSLGPAFLRLQMQGPDPLLTPGRAPFTAASAMMDYRARLGVELGSLSFSAFYDRQGGFGDPFALSDNSLRLGAASGLGGGLVGSLWSDRLNFELEGASLRALEDDLSRMAYLRSSLRVSLTPRLSVNVGAQFTRMFGPGVALDAMTYTMGLQRSFGRNASLSFIFNTSVPGRGFGDAGGSIDSSSAITQVSVKF